MPTRLDDARWGEGREGGRVHALEGEVLDTRSQGYERSGSEFRWSVFSFISNESLLMVIGCWDGRFLLHLPRIW